MGRLYETRSISGKTALVTGASAGIGRACAFLLAEQGTHVMLVARREDKLVQVKDEILTLFPNANVQVEVCDISSPADVATLTHRLPTVDILVNNAGLALGVETGDEGSMDDTVTMFNTNVIGSIALIKGLAKQMRSQNSGEIVNIGSVAATDHYNGGAIYCATKSAIEAYSSCLRMDLVDTDIRVTTINPGIVGGTEFSLVRFRGDTQKAATPYEGLDFLTAMDVADQVIYAITRPINVQIAQIKSYCNQQGHAKYVVSRK